jgi:hypothetical protein
VKSLREWSGRRVAAVALGWILGLPLLAAPALFGAVGWLARAERQRAVVVPDSVAPGLRVDYGAAQSSDVLISFAGPGVILLLTLFLVPPLALSVTWLIARRSQSDQPA